MLATRLRNLYRFLTAPRQRIETDTDPESLDALLGNIQRVWSNYASADPYFSVLTKPIYKGAPRQDIVEQFYATGAAEAQFVRCVVERHGARIEQIRTILEFGCGLGRVSYWLTREFARVVGVDISQGHIDIATHYMATHGVTNFSPLRIKCIADLDHLPGFDALYSRIVLQHNPPPVVKIILSRLLEKLTPGGFAIFQVPIAGPQYSFSVARHLAHQQHLTEMELHAFPVRAVYRIAWAHDCEVLEVHDTDDTEHPDWPSNTFVIRKRFGGKS
jgi:2-polyprenyl-3-methyl-5-hydroxy-6-metoxy-1,4-benzoquinol methylase